MAKPTPKHPPNMLNAMFSAPIPGHSLTHEPKNMPWEHPPQFVQVDEAMNFLMNQLLEPFYLKQMLQLMNAGMSIEAITRTIIMTGFATGKWTPTLGMLLYKPLMLALISIAKRAGLTDTPVAHPSMLNKYNMGKFKQHMSLFPNSGSPEVETPQEEALPTEEVPEVRQGGFMSRNY